MVISTTGSHSVCATRTVGACGNGHCMYRDLMHNSNSAHRWLGAFVSWVLYFSHAYICLCYTGQLTKLEALAGILPNINSPPGGLGFPTQVRYQC